ncbi:20426_t:CDS:1 [Funneliformis geosporum]|uniref:7086_t:CDS:1 n=1 Tax=Funneliformis geosporum TaxID=1117311 RepID=A0A9W4WIY4_9GLOM|nr:20426_t:CDS:1 [Funneliformis geosporum]CAI2165262.1 7086_t:CDS:1 [Funneliformis geosporum]
MNHASYSSNFIKPFTLNSIGKLTTLPSLPDDILFIIKKDLDFASTIALRSACRQLYSALPDSLLFSKIVLPPTLTQQQFDNLFSYLLSTNKTQIIRNLTFDQSQVTERAIISVMKHCKNLQDLCILSCKNVMLLPMTNAMVQWHQDKSGNSPDLKELKKINLTRCIGGKRHSLTIKKVIQDLRKLQSNSESELYDDSISAKINLIINSTPTQSLLDGVFQLRNCQDDTCEFCTMSCASCKARYKYWDEFWIKCGWCKGRNFCGPCITESSRKNRFKNYAFQFMRIKLCQMFELPCPY